MPTTLPPVPLADPVPQAEIDEATRRRTREAIAWSLRSILVALGRDYERCGKASCARSRRCRGFACEPEEEL